MKLQSIFGTLGVNLGKLLFKDTVNVFNSLALFDCLGQQLLVASFSCVCEPVLNLSFVQTCFDLEKRKLLLANVRIFNVFKKPLLHNYNSLLLKVFAWSLDVGFGQFALILILKMKLSFHTSMKRVQRRWYFNLSNFRRFNLSHGCGLFVGIRLRVLRKKAISEFVMG